MVTSSAKTVKEFLAGLPPDRRAAIGTVRDAVRARLPPGYEEGMILAGLQAQKQYNALYLMTVYGDPAIERWFRDAFEKAGKKLDMGKSCVRFKSADDLPLDVIGEVIARVGVDAYVASVEAVQGSARKTRARNPKKPAAKKPAAKKPAAKKPAASARARRR